MVRRSPVVVGTRGSRLALCQTELVVGALRSRHPDLAFEVREVRTEGDQRAEVPLSQLGGQGVFVKELEASLVRRDIDLAVHSLKDVPGELTPGLALAAIPERADPRDALVSRDGVALRDLPVGARIGTGSGRRAVQLRALRPDLAAVDIRGNVDTRIRKVDEGEVDATVLAAAGLARLGLLDRASEVLGVEAIVPAVSQGALAVEARENDNDLLELLTGIEHEETRVACTAERAFLARLGGGCRLPLGALAVAQGPTLRMRGFISDEAGRRVFRADIDGRASRPEDAGVRLAETLLERGAAEFVGAGASP